MPITLADVKALLDTELTRITQPDLIARIRELDQSMGMDNAWYVSLEDAFRESVAWHGNNPPGREVE